MKPCWLLLLILCLSLTSCSRSFQALPSDPAFMEDSIENGESQDVIPPFRYGRSFLSTSAQQAYDRLCGLADTFQTGVVNLPPSLSDSDISALIRAFSDDNPGYFWVDLKFESEDGERLLRLEALAGMNLQEARERMDQVESKAETLLDGVEGSDFSVAVQLHDRLGEHIYYNRYSQMDDAGTVFGALVNRSAICDGYSRSYQYLLARRGIPCIYIAGTTLRGLTHSWNAVQLDGEWYYVDLTWDDRGRVRHDYCLVSLEQMEREHIWDDTQYPALPTGGAARDYYEIWGYSVSPEAEDQVGAFANAFVLQLENGFQFDEGDTAFLEIKVAGSDEDYLAAKEWYIRNLFAILTEMDRLLRERESGIRFVSRDEVACNYNDEMHILTLFPRVEYINDRAGASGDPANS